MSYALALIPSLLVFILGAWWRRVEKDKDALAAVQVSRIYTLEQSASQWTSEFHALDKRLTKAETLAEAAVDAAHTAMTSLKELIEERFSALNRRIDDSFRPPPKRR